MQERAQPGFRPVPLQPSGGTGRGMLCRSQGGRRRLPAAGRGSSSRKHSRCRGLVSGASSSYSSLELSAWWRTTWPAGLQSSRRPTGAMTPRGCRCLRRSAILDACGTAGSSSSGSKAEGQPSPLPEGEVQLAWSLDAEAAPCFNYLPSPDGNWTLDTTSGPWGERPGTFVLLR